jgi:hypothetical protein
MHRSHEDRYTLIAPKLYILRRAVQLAGDAPQVIRSQPSTLMPRPTICSSVLLATLLYLATVSTRMMGSREQHGAAD